MDALTVRLPGSFGVTVVGVSPPGPELGGRKARRLLMLLAVHRGQDVGVDRIVEALWDGDLPRQPERNVATMVSRLRAVLGSDVITGGPNFYRLARLGWSENGSLVASTVLRGSYHLYQGLGGGVGNLLMGLVFGRYWQRTNRLWALIVAHALMRRRCVRRVCTATRSHLLAPRLNWRPGRIRPAQ